MADFLTADEVFVALKMPGKTHRVNTMALRRMIEKANRIRRDRKLCPLTPFKIGRRYHYHPTFVGELIETLTRRV